MTHKKDTGLPNHILKKQPKQSILKSKNIIESQYQRAIKILTENKDKLITLAEILLKKEVIFKEDLEKIFGKRVFGTLEEKQPESLSDVFGENKDFPKPENPVEPKI